MAIAVVSLTASTPLLPGQTSGNRHNGTRDFFGERRPAFVPRSMPKRPGPEATPPVRDDGGEPIPLPAESRTTNGSSNNLQNPLWGTAGQATIRILPNDYADGSSQPAGAKRPSARAISNAVVAQEKSLPNAKGATDFLWQWGQFLGHDIIETPTIDPEEPFDIPVPAGDPFFDPTGTGNQVIALNRSLYEDLEGVREQVNAISAYIDGSQIYGSDDERAFALRKLDGSGQLKVTESALGDLLPYNEGGFDNAPSPSPGFFLAGDVRANEQVGLTALHTLFVREHNYWAVRFAELNPQAMGEEIYQFARMIVGAELQAITYRKFLPVLIGRDALPPYRGYREDVRADISNAFGATAFRIGHSMLSPQLLRVDAAGNEIVEGHLSLAASFFDPTLTEETGIDPVLRGLATQVCEELDAQLVDEVRNFLFGPPGAGGFDLASLNIQRGRDHGMPGLNAARRSLGLRNHRLFANVTRDRELAAKLQEVYQHPDQIDLWVGGLCEPDLPGSMVGATFQKILVDQFTRLRDGDRFYYEGAMPRELVKMINQQTLATIIKRNTEIGDELQDNVFLSIETERHPGGHNGRRQPRKSEANDRERRDRSKR